MKKYIILLVLIALSAFNINNSYAEHTLTCFAYKSYAELAMRYRQSDTSKKYTMGIFKEIAEDMDLRKDHKKPFFDLVEKAYLVPTTEDYDEQEKIIVEYGNIVYAACVKSGVTPG